MDDAAMMDSVRDRIREFAVVRDWGQLQEPKNFAVMDTKGGLLPGSGQAPGESSVNDEPSGGRLRGK